ncbi:MAG: hypothetical protein LBJ73_02830 [Rickettsiales bacterium]|jgi:hypothetical protein|nr:hypothetical protein [Rickettsiales bacterium]
MSELRPGQRSFDYQKFPGRTKQSFKDECDINKIMARIMKTGVDPFIDRVQMGKFLDLEHFPDFMAAQDHINSMYAYFDRLPSSVRALFDNNPSNLVDFLSDPKNKDEAVKLGLLSADKPVEASSEASAQPPAEVSAVAAGATAPNSGQANSAAAAT